MPSSSILAFRMSTLVLYSGAPQICREAPLKVGYQALFNILQILGCPVRGKDDLFATLVQLVKNIKKISCVLGLLARN